MVKKPWSNIEGGKSLEAFLGAYGYRTSEIETSEDLVMEAARVYEIPPVFDVSAMAAAVKAIPAARRRELAYKNIPQGMRSRVDSGQVGQRADTGDGPETDYKKLFHLVVGAVTGSGHGDILKELPDVLAYYKCRIPTVADVIGGRPETAIIEGGITFDDRVYRFSCARRVGGSAC